MMLFLLACTPAPADSEKPHTSDSSTDSEADSPADSPAPAPPPRAVWVWYPPWDEPGPFVDALVAGGFTDAWLCDYEPTEDHHALLGELHAAGLSAWALAGDPSWARGDAAEQHAAAVAAFNLAGEPYDGIQHDTEIHALPAFQTDPEAVTAEFAATLPGIREAGGVPLMVATAIWLEPELYAQIAANVDAIALMDYRDTVERIEADAAEEMASSTPAWIGLELMEDPEGDTVSFYEEGHDALVAAMEQVAADSEELPGYAGMAVHDWDAWVSVP